MVLSGAPRSLERVSSATLTIVVSRTAMMSPTVVTPATTSVDRSSPPDRRSTSRLMGGAMDHPSSASAIHPSSVSPTLLALLPGWYRRCGGSARFDRDLDVQERPASGGPRDLELSAKGLHAIRETDEPRSASGIGPADPVIANRQLDEHVAGRDVDAHRGRAR